MRAAKTYTLSGVYKLSDIVIESNNAQRSDFGFRASASPARNISIVHKTVIIKGVPDVASNTNCTLVMAMIPVKKAIFERSSHFFKRRTSVNPRIAPRIIDGSLIESADKPKK